MLTLYFTQTSDPKTFNRCRWYDLCLGHLVSGLSVFELRERAGMGAFGLNGFRAFRVLQT